MQISTRNRIKSCPFDTHTQPKWYLERRWSSALLSIGFWPQSWLQLANRLNRCGLSCGHRLYRFCIAKLFLRPLLSFVTVDPRFCLSESGSRKRSWNWIARAIFRPAGHHFLSFWLQICLPRRRRFSNDIHSKCLDWPFIDDPFLRNPQLFLTTIDALCRSMTFTKMRRLLIAIGVDWSRVFDIFWSSHVTVGRVLRHLFVSFLFRLPFLNQSWPDFLPKLHEWMRR